jgi:hypothetical protein
LPWKIVLRHYITIGLTTVHDYRSSAFLKFNRSIICVYH